MIKTDTKVTVAASVTGTSYNTTCSGSSSGRDRAGTGSQRSTG